MRLPCIVRDGKPEADREQAVLLAYGPRAGKAKALAQPEHGFEAADWSTAPRRLHNIQSAMKRGFRQSSASAS